MRTHADASHNTEAGSGGTRTSGVRRLKVGLAATAVFMATFAGLTAAGVTPAGASTLDGTATIANPSNDSALASGGSDTYFTLNLPAQSHCDGDSASDGYFVFSYLVKEGTNPAGVSFRTGEPGMVTGSSPLRTPIGGPPSPHPKPDRSSASPTTWSSDRW